MTPKLTLFKRLHSSLFAPFACLPVASEWCNTFRLFVSSSIVAVLVSIQITTRPDALEETSTIRVTELYDCTTLTIIIYRNSQYNLSICRGAHDTCSRWHFWNCTLKPRLVGWFSRAVAAAFRGGTSSRRRNNPCSSTVVLRRIIKPNDHPQIQPSRYPYSTLTTRPTTLAFAFCDCGDFKHIEISFCAFIGLRFWRHKTWPWPRERASLCRWNCLLSCPYSVHQNGDRQTSSRARKQT